MFELRRSQNHEGHLPPKLEVLRLTCPGQESNPGLHGGRRAPVFRIRIYFSQIRIQHFGWIPMRIRIQGLMTQNQEKISRWKKYSIFLSKTTIYLSIGLYKGRSSYRRSLQPLKEENHPALQNMKLIFSIFVGHFWPPGSGFTDLIESGSGSETIVSNSELSNYTILGPF